MLTFYHAPRSRSGRVHWLLHEIGAEVDLVPVDIRRQDGSGAIDPRNPHPDGKVPALVHDGALITETPAILLYLTDLFPKAGLGPGIGDPQRGAYLTWMVYYGSVMEPVYVLDFCGLGDNPVLQTTFRGVPEIEARLTAALRDRPYLLGDRFSAADLLICSPYLVFPDAVPDAPQVRDWMARCTGRPAYRRHLETDALPEWQGG